MRVLCVTQPAGAHGDVFAKKAAELGHPREAWCPAAGAPTLRAEDEYRSPVVSGAPYRGSPALRSDAIDDAGALRE